MTRRHAPAPRRRIIRNLLLLALLVLAVCPYLLVRDPGLPPGMDTRSGPFLTAADDLSLVMDTTAWDPVKRERVMDQRNFEVLLRLVREAETFLLLDFFLWNEMQGEVREEHRHLCRELALALMQKKIASPAMPIVVLSDPINRLYGPGFRDFHQRLSNVGIGIIFTDLDRLPESNPVYARPLRFYGAAPAAVPPLRRLLQKPWLPNPLDKGGDKVSAAQYARLLKFKANHRKVIVAGMPDGRVQALVTSFNPADGSSAHANVGLLFSGPAAVAAARNELEIMAWSAARPGGVVELDPGRAADAVRQAGEVIDALPVVEAEDDGAAQVEWLTEGAIGQRIVNLLDETSKGDEVRIALFYLADRVVVEALERAAVAGASLRLILDPNRDAFGKRKIGVPNRPVAHELLEFARRSRGDLAVRWADTHGEQYHLKAMSIVNPAKEKYIFLCGSANWTRRNLRNLNLEANVCATRAKAVTDAFARHFDKAWNNEGDLTYTVPYTAFVRYDWRFGLKLLLYRIQEPTGMCSF